MRAALYALAYLQLLLIQTTSLTCDATHMNYVSRFTLGKQDELNRTFTKIQQKISTLSDFNYKTSTGAVYQITGIKLNYTYRDSKQRAQFRGENVIVIDGGFAEVQCSFNWVRKFLTNANGSVVAIGLTDDLSFAKKVVIDGPAYSYELLDTMPFLMQSKAFSFTRINPPDTSESDKTVLLSLLNGIDGGQDIKTFLQRQMEKSFKYYLNSSLHDQHFPLDAQFDYKWVPGAGRQNLTVSFVRRAVTVDVQKIGLISSFQVQVENATKWQCGSRKVPDMPLDEKLFGGIQEYVSFDLYQNVIRWALSNGIFDSDLKKQNWGNRMFQFFAGDLYEIFPQTQSSFYANQIVSGKCVGSSSGLAVVSNDNNSFNVSLNFGCNLMIKAEKITDFSVGLNLAVTGQPGSSYLDFKVKSFSQKVSFVPSGKYKLENKDLAQMMVADSLKRLYEGNLFGSGWPQSPPRDYPHFQVFTNYTAIFDSSLVSAPQVRDSYL